MINCVICQKKSCKKDYKLYSVSEDDKTELLSKAMKFNLDSVYTRFLFMRIRNNLLLLMYLVISNVRTSIYYSINETIR